MGDECSSVDVFRHGVGGRERGRRAKTRRRIGRYQLADDGTVVAADDGLVALTGADRSAVVGEHVEALLHVGGEDGYLRALERVRQRGDLGEGTLDVTVDTADGTALPCRVRVSALRGEQGTWASLGELYRRPDEGGGDESPTVEPETAPPAAGPASLDATIRRLSRELGTLTGRERFAATVCDRLATLPRYGAVWYGRPRECDAVLEPEGSAGLDPVEEGSRSLRTDGDGIVGRAVDTGEIQVSGPGNPVGDGAFPAAAAVAAVPLVHRETTYGLLVMTAQDPEGFGPVERDALADLGAILGHATCCLRARRALMAGQVTEVTLLVREEGLFLAALSERLDCRVTVEGLTFATDDAPLHYVTVHCGAPDRLRAFAAERADLRRFEVVSEHDDACVIAVAPTSPTLHRTAAAHGAVVRDLVFESGDATVTVELPDAGDTRALLWALRSQFGYVTLAAQRDRPRSIETRRQFRAALLDRLSDRQRTALELAHHAGYFEWPRERTGEDIAASMDVSAPTFHKHLRHAQRKLADAVLATEEGC
ncbi:bacterio-opsin activator domain-containing protein [Halorientalis halophila]|uniref:bacterio-opsin activator domain-containing protein n=1 Tax=Halorientalis halophila TaxID=3108499 RepID=UPI00300845CD